MEWVEFTARTVEEAKELALDRLMVDVNDAEFEVLEEPKTGLFGRLRGEARVRARVRPTPVRQKLERRDRRRIRRGTEGSDGAGDGPTAAVDREEAGDEVLDEDAGDAGEGERPPRHRRRRGGRGKGGGGRTAGTAEGAGDEDRFVSKEQESVDAADGSQADQVEQVGKEAERFISGLVEAFGLHAQTRLSTTGTDLEISVEGDNLGLLVGPRGLTLQAVQDLARVASQRRLHDHDTRLRVDIGGYRKRRSESLARFVTQVAEDVKSSGVARVLDPMSSADRKVIHDALTSVEGISTRSEGEEPSRRVVIAPSEPIAG